MSIQETPQQVGIGSRVGVELLDEQGNAEALTLDIVRAEAADFERGLLGANTPLAQAILGKFVGRSVAYRMGDIVSVRILSATPAESDAPADAAARRQAILDKALRDAERTNADMFAASYSGKWGDYDTAEVDDE